jgi:hypothetical protein
MFFTPSADAGPTKLCNRHHIQTDHKGRVAELGTILRPAAENIWLMGRLKRKIKPRIEKTQQNSMRV